MTTIRARQPAGAPSSAGGQFTGVASPGPTVALMSPTAELPYGSISFPSASIAEGATAETFLERFRSLPVGDRVASNALFLNLQALREAVQRFVNDELGQRLAPGGDLTESSDAYVATHPTWTAAELDRLIVAPAERDAFARAEQALRHVEMPGSAVVDIVQVAAARRFSGLLPEVERERLRNLVVTVGRRQMTVREVCDTYLTTQWIHNALTDTDVALAAAMRATAEAIERAVGR